MIAAIYCLYFICSLGAQSYAGKPGWWRRFGKLAIGAVLLGSAGVYLQDARASGETVLAGGLVAGVGFSMLAGISSGLAYLLRPKKVEPQAMGAP